jgi:hypothetical protein
MQLVAQQQLPLQDIRQLWSEARFYLEEVEKRFVWTEELGAKNPLYRMQGRVELFTQLEKISDQVWKLRNEIAHLEGFYAQNLPEPALMEFNLKNCSKRKMNIK